MNLSVPSLPAAPDPSRSGKNSNGIKAADASIADTPGGGFDEVLADVAQTGDSPPAQAQDTHGSAMSTARRNGARGLEMRADSQVSSKKKAVDEVPLEGIAIPFTPPQPIDGCPEEVEILTSGNEEPDSSPGAEDGLETSEQEVTLESAEQPEGFAEVPEPADETSELIADSKATAEKFPEEHEQPRRTAVETAEAAELGFAKAAKDSLSEAARESPPIETRSTPSAEPSRVPAAAFEALAKSEAGEKALRLFAGDKRVLRNGAPSANPKSDAAADFAGIAGDTADTDDAPKNALLKNFLTSSGKELTLREHLLGTNVANFATEMASASPTQFLESVSSRNTSLAPGHMEAATAASAAAPDFSPAPTPALNAAHQAIEAVMKVAERFTTESQRAVRLQFSVSGEDLSVRVEMHAGRVHTTFQTDSAELRSALAHEWQALTVSHAERTHRFADPVYSSAESSFSSGGNASPENQRGHDMHQPGARFEIPSRSLPARAAATAVAAVNSLHPMVPSTTHRLHTFA
jgi:hypothetical protein